MAIIFTSTTGSSSGGSGDSGGGGSIPSLSNPGIASDLLSGKQLVDQNGNVITGTMPSVSQATPSISVDGRGLITASSTQSKGYVTGGTKSATNQLSTQSGTTITPSTYTQTAVSPNKYTTGYVYVQGDSNLVSSNIKSGVSIFGVSGSYTGSSSRGSLPNIGYAMYPSSSSTPSVSTNSIAFSLRSGYNDTSKVLLVRLFCDTKDYSLTSSDSNRYIICIDIYDPFHWSTNKTNQYVTYYYDTSRSKPVTIISSLSYNPASTLYNVNTSGTGITVTIANSSYKFLSSLSYSAYYFYLK